MDSVRGGALATALFLAMAAPAWVAPFGGVNPGVDALAQALQAAGF
ncbi:MAG: hypothetical protein ACK46X_13625 [Candidatus Sericytochromatia bacterium]